MKQLGQRIGAKLKQQTARRAAALLLLLCFALLMIFVDALIITHAHHGHEHAEVRGTCTTCVHIRIAEQTLKHLAAAVVIILLAFGLALMVRAILTETVNALGAYTPIILKTRLNN